MATQGLFVGLVTLDLIYRTAQLPERNQKLVASDYLVAAGGPATNAAVAFSHLGTPATVMGVVGSHPITHLILTDLQQCGVTIHDLAPTQSDPPPVSSILVTEATGERAVISINAVKTQAAIAAIPNQVLDHTGVILIDGHQIEVGRAIAQRGKTLGIPIVLDGGSWKPGLDRILPWVDYAICSANFQPPGCHSETDVFCYLANLGIPYIAITHGEQPIQYRDRRESGTIAVPSIPAVDTLGAGDIFHGAFCHYLLQTNFVEALTLAAEVAAHSCQFFGTRAWRGR
ncbi:sugar kinase [Pantanalinema rosaneae CENA516]|uniref:sugar kinase n=1 Tax=Pantanalinema rosaneae TaxID=1620701 RepID=UPI003D6F2742